MNRERKHISDKLYKLIYQPSLVPNWKEFPVNVKLYMFKNYFLLLNKEFQKQFGGNIERNIKYIKELFKCVESEDYIPDFKFLDNALGESEKHCICEALMMPQSKNESIVIKFDPLTLYDLLERKARYNWCAGGIDAEDDTVYRQDIVDIGLKSHYLVDIDDPKRKKTDYVNALCKKYRRNRKKELPGIVYLAVKIYKPKEQLIEQFSSLVSEYQDEYFKLHPEDKNIKFGHLERKVDGRSKSYPFDEWERYFKVYVMFELGKKQREIAEQFFPQDAVGSGEAKISQDLRKARKLIKNAWEGDFPGKYYYKT